MAATKNAPVIADGNPEYIFPVGKNLPAGAISAVGLTLPAKLDEAVYTEVGQGLGRVEKALAWAIGDWWIYGEDHGYGSRKALVTAEDWQGPSFQTCMNAAAVCRAFETSRRREVLSLAHHAEVMALSKQQQTKLLDWCQATIAETGKPRSVKALRAEVARRAGKAKPQAARDKVLASLAATGLTPEKIAEVNAKLEAGETVQTTAVLSTPCGQTFIRPVTVSDEGIALAEPTPQGEPIPSMLDPATLNVNEAVKIIRSVLTDARKLLMAHSPLRRWIADAEVALEFLRDTAKANS